MLLADTQSLKCCGSRDRCGARYIAENAYLSDD